MNAPMSDVLPGTITAYLEQLRAALAGADPALLQDALYDAEDYLRSEMAAQPGVSEAEVVASVAASYGHPAEVAQIYLETEVTVQRALHGSAARTLPVAAASSAPAMPTVAVGAAPAAAAAAAAATAAPGPAGRPGVLKRVLGVYTDPRTYGALFYLLLSLITGVFYFTWTVTGISLSLGMLILIIGVPLLVLFLGSVRVLALVEGRLVETLLGVRMPRRPPYVDREQGWLKRIGAMFTDVRTWSTMAYFALMLPLGTAYFSAMLTLLSAALCLLLAPLVGLAGMEAGVWVGGVNLLEHLWSWPLLVVIGAVLLTATLHLARALGSLHGMLAKHLLVRGG